MPIFTKNILLLFLNKIVKTFSNVNHGFGLSLSRNPLIFDKWLQLLSDTNHRPVWKDSSPLLPLKGAP